MALRSLPIMFTLADVKHTITYYTTAVLEGGSACESIIKASSFFLGKCKLSESTGDRFIASEVYMYG